MDGLYRTFDRLPHYLQAHYEETGDRITARHTAL